MRLAGFLLLPFLAGCAALSSTPPVPPSCALDASPGVWVIERAWHTELALPASALQGPLAPIREQNPDATGFLFGFGKRSWMVAQLEKDPLALLSGPLPGEGVVQVIPLRRAPEVIFAGNRMVRVPLPPGGLDALERRLAASFAGFTPIARPPGNDFFLAAEGYTLAYTCNTWTAEVLAAAGVPVRAEGVVFTSGVMRQAGRVPGACR